VRREGKEGRRQTRKKMKKTLQGRLYWNQKTGKCNYYYYYYYFNVFQVVEKDH
jgi:hypothetical protein